MSEEDIKDLTDIISYLGFSFFKPDVGEAEAVCCYLANKGYVNGVISNDSDVLAYDVDLFLYDINPFTESVVVYKKLNVLNSVNMTKETFLDFCIMCGTDYNTNIPRVGPVSSFLLLQEKKSIDNIDREEKTILNHINVRNLFSSFQDFNEHVEIKKANPVDIEQFIEYLVMKNSKVDYTFLKSIWKRNRNNEIIIT